MALPVKSPATSVSASPRQAWDNLYKHLSSDTLQQKAMIDAGLLVENAETGKRYDRFATA